MTKRDENLINHKNNNNNTQKDDHQMSLSIPTWLSFLNNVMMSNNLLFYASDSIINCMFCIDVGFGGGDGGTSSASQAARIKFGGISFRNRDTQSDMYATSQL